MALAEVAGQHELAVVPEHGSVFVQRQFAVSEDVAAIGHPERQLDVLLDEQYAAPRVGGIPTHDREEPFDDDRREPQTQFVEE